MVELKGYELALMPYVYARYYRTDGKFWTYISIIEYERFEAGESVEVEFDLVIFEDDGIQYRIAERVTKDITIAELEANVASFEELIKKHQ